MDIDAELLSLKKELDRLSRRLSNELTEEKKRQISLDIEALNFKIAGLVKKKEDAENPKKWD